MKRALSKEVCFDSAPPDHKTAHIFCVVESRARTVKQKAWSGAENGEWDFAQTFFPFASHSSRVEALMFAPWISDLKEKPTVLQSTTPLTFNISVCFRALCFSPSRMAMGCCTMWQEALRVRSQLTTYKERCLAKRFTLKCWLSLTGYGDLKGLHSSLSFSTSRGIMSLIVY